MKDKVEKWCTEEGILKEKVDDPNSEFNLVISFPDEAQVLNILQPKGKDYVWIVSRTVVSSEHKERLKKKSAEELENFLWDLRFTLASRPTSFNLQISNGVLEGFTITYRIYSDGLNKHTLMQAIREVHKSRLIVLWKLIHATK